MKLKIKTQIDPNQITGLPQEVEVAQIAYMDFDIQEAKIKFRVYALDQDGNRIESNTTTYEFWENFSNSNILTQEGLIINETNFPKEDEESDEDYQNRLEEMRSTGIPEFNFWVSPLMDILNGALEQGKHLLHLPK